MYVKIKLTDEPSWPMCILDLSKQPAKGTAQNTERLNVNGAACSSSVYPILLAISAAISALSGFHSTLSYKSDTSCETVVGIEDISKVNRAHALLIASASK